MGEEPGTLEEVYEPFLIQEGFLKRTPRGREATRLAYEHLGLKPPARRPRRRATRSPSCRSPDRATPLHRAQAPVRLEDLDYDLPPELIAQHPAARREDARLLVVERASGRLHDSRIADLRALAAPRRRAGLNETRVRPARLDVRRASGGRVELLFVRPEPGGLLARAREAGEEGRGPARLLTTDDGCLALEVVGPASEGERVVRVVAGRPRRALEAHGRVPLPPYIHRAARARGPRALPDRLRARGRRGRGAHGGAALHEALLGALAAQGVSRVPAAAARRPRHVPAHRRARPAGARMDEEWFELAEGPPRRWAPPAPRADASSPWGRPACARSSRLRPNGGGLAAASGWTRKFILPPYAFRAVDALLTNFHLPRTTLLLLVAALAGEELLRRAYAHAVPERYRFYSYGDAMLVV